MIGLVAKIFSAFLAGLVISKAYLDYKRRKESRAMFYFWTIAWLGIVFIAFSPIVIDRLIERLGGRQGGIGTLLGMAIVFIFFVVYRLYVKADRIERLINRFVKEQSLKDLKENSNQ